MQSGRRLHVQGTQRKAHNNKSGSFWTSVFFAILFVSLGLLALVLYSDFDVVFPAKLPSPRSAGTSQSATPARNSVTISNPLTNLRTVPTKTEVIGRPVTDSIKPVIVAKRKRYAYAITINKDGSFQDGAAVLAYSIMKYSWNASYDISFVAFVHPNVTTSRPALKRLGYHVIEVPTPINASAIKFDFLREKINKNGCCGAAELIKLTSYRLVQYDRVIHLDADVILLNSIDELFEKDKSLIYTTDPNMATFKGPDKMPVQGGFLVIRPSIADYRAIIHTQMTTEFKKHHGWNSSHIGWFWGGMTVQGILPYYYRRVSQPADRLETVDRCYYNTMADTPECNLQKIEELKSAHFTVCQKPWGCWEHYFRTNKKENPLCYPLHQRWVQLRKEAEVFYGLVPSLDQAQVVCAKPGAKNYPLMPLHKAVFPSARPQQQEGKRNPFAHYARNVVPDDSADRIEPIFPESQYIDHSHFD